MTEEKTNNIDDRLLKFKNAISGMIVSSKEGYSKSNDKASRSRSKNYSEDEIKQIVHKGNPVEKAELSEYFFLTNGLYKRVILHYATFLTYSWLLVPAPKR